MARSTEKLNRIELVKKRAPKVPPNTCPYINFVIEVLEEQMKYSDDKCDELRKSTLIETLEYIRRANETLRASSKYWYEEYKKIA